MQLDTGTSCETAFPAGTCPGTGPYGGSFTSGGKKTVATTDSTGKASANYNVDTLVGALGFWSSSTPQPTDASPTATLLPVNSTDSSPGIRTIAGVPAKFTVSLCLTSPAAPPFSSCTGYNPTSAVNSTTIYADVTISDAYGNLATNPGPSAIQITLSPSGGVLSAITVYVLTGASDTFTNFGAIAWTLPGTITTGIKLTATGVLNGATATAFASVNTVAPFPSIKITGATAPAKLSAGVIYSPSGTVVFNGWAAVSIGYAQLSSSCASPYICIKSVKYKLGSGASGSAVITSKNNVTFAVAVTFPNGLSTIQFNATDTTVGAHATVWSSVWQVLVDTGPPTVKFTTAAKAQLQAGNPVTATIVDLQGDLNASAVTGSMNGTAIPKTAIAVTGTNNLGKNTTYTVAITLPAGRWVIALSAKDLAGQTSATVQLLPWVLVIVPISQSFSLVGTAKQITFNGFPAVNATYLNQLPTTQQGVAFGVVNNAKGQTVLITTSTITPTSGGKANAILVLAGLTSGTYSVSIFVISPQGVAISLKTTITVTV
jgi:hypothetical protein